MYREQKLPVIQRRHSREMYTHFDGYLYSHLEDTALDLVLLDADGLRPLGGHWLGGVLLLEPDLGLGLPLLVGDERDVARV